MRIFYSPKSDPMVLDSITGLNNIYKRLLGFLASEQQSLKFKAETNGTPAPYDQFLPYLQFIKTKNPVFVSFAEDKGLVIQGSIENLRVYISNFEFEENEDGGHHHPEYDWKENYMQSGSISIIIEADNYYIKERLYNQNS